MKPLFESHADAALELVRSTYAQRGNEYGDGWRTCQWTVLQAIAKQVGVILKPEQCRAIALAVLVDVKRERLGGGYKEDSLIDGIAYEAALISEVRAWNDYESGKV